MLQPEEPQGEDEYEEEEECIVLEGTLAPAPENTGGSLLEAEDYELQLSQARAPAIWASFSMHPMG